MRLEISDLFFNHDVSAAVQMERGEFAGYDEGLLLEEAEWFVETLGTLGVPDLPTAPDLVANFLGRL